MKSIVIIESIILCVVIFFFWFAWPMIENNLNTHPCNISTYNGIDSRYDNPCG